MAPLSLVSRRVSLLAAVVVVTLGALPRLGAQSTGAAGALVEVRNVKFTKVRPPEGGDAWLEAAVDLGIAVNPAAAGARWADHVQVTLWVSLATQDSGMFRASAEAVALEAGRATVRFYLPPEILRREQVSTDPLAYAVDVGTRGQTAPAAAAAAAPVLRNADAMRSFRDRVARAAPQNDGVLVPQYLSPFAASYPGDTPSFVRRER